MQECFTSINMYTNDTFSSLDFKNQLFVYLEWTSMILMPLDAIISIVWIPCANYAVIIALDIFYSLEAQIDQFHWSSRPYDFTITASNERAI